MRNAKPKWSLTEFAMHWVHASARSNAARADSHALFIALHLTIGTLALMAMPLVLSLSGGLSLGNALTFAALLGPLVIAFLVSKTGKLQWGTLLSLVLTTSFIAWISLLTGGIGSFLLFWFCVIPIESALFGGVKGLRRGMYAAMAGFALVAVISLLPGILARIALPHIWPGIYQITIIAALCYTAILAYRIERRHVRSSSMLREEESKFRMLADNSSDLITRHLPDGKTLFASPAATRLFGCQPDRLQDAGYFDKIHLHDRVVFLRTISASAAENQETACEFRIAFNSNIAPDKFRWVELRCRPVIDNMDKTVTVVAVTRDISAAKTLQHELQLARTEAEQSNAAKSRFLANMSHELRTPLNAILGFSDLLKMANELKITDTSRTEYAELIHDAGDHLLKVVNDILDVSKIEAGQYDLQPEICDLKKLVNSTVSMLSPQSTAGNVDVSATIPADLPSVVADHRAIRQIMINLVSNAIKFTPENGRVQITIVARNGHVSIGISDSGIGIAEADLKILGKPFSQVGNKYDRPHEGTGLGLSIVKGLVALHSGTFKLESKLGKGTTVFVDLPLQPVIAKPVPTSPEENLVWLNPKPKTRNTQQELVLSDPIERKSHARATR